MNNRQRFFNVLEEKPIDHAPFFPDISIWYENTRKEFGKEVIFGAGMYIPDELDFHSLPSRMPEPYSKMTYLDYYREYDWGLPVHIADWYTTTYSGNVEVEEKRTAKTKEILYKTPKGDLSRCYHLDQDGSWAPFGYLIKEIRELDVLKYILNHTHYQLNPQPVEKFLKETEGFGVCDLVIKRSPFGKLIHENLGFIETIYALEDETEVIEKFLEEQEACDWQLIELAAKSAGSLVIISDHADENLISPLQYKKYCMPYYKKVCDYLHRKGKYVSTHLDGNMKAYLDFIGDTGFHLLDGCTPAPMFNYEVEELRDAIQGKTHCYMGVPASLLTNTANEREILEMGKRIVNAFNGKVIVNIGDIVPINGDINLVIKLGEQVIKTPLEKT